MFQQDLTGQINGNNNTELSIDTVDIAPYRYRNETVQPTTPILRNSTTAINTTPNLSEKQDAPSSFITISRPPVIIIKKGSSISPRSPRSSTNEINNENSFVSNRSSNTNRQSIIEETFNPDSAVELKKASFSQSNRNINNNNNNNEITQTKVIYAQSSSKTLGQLIPNDYDSQTYSTSIADILIPKTNLTVTSSSNDYSEYEESNNDSNNNNESNNYGIPNLVSVIETRSQTMPSKKLIKYY